MNKVEAVDQEFPSSVPARVTTVLTVRVRPHGWEINLNVRPGSARSVREASERWAPEQLARLEDGQTDVASEWVRHEMPDGTVLLQKWGALESLPPLG